MNRNEQVDEKGTSQNEALEMLKSLRDGAFDGSTEKLAVALGRPVPETESWLKGTSVIDDDVVMKMRGIARERAVTIEQGERE